MASVASSQDSKTCTLCIQNQKGIEEIQQISLASSTNNFSINIPEKIVVRVEKTFPSREQLSCQLRFQRVNNAQNKIKSFLIFLQQHARAAVAQIGDMKIYILPPTPSDPLEEVFFVYQENRKRKQSALAGNSLPAPKRSAVASSHSSTGSIYSRMPKGCILHMHFSGYVRYSKILDFLEAEDLPLKVLFDDVKGELSFSDLELNYIRNVPNFASIKQLVKDKHADFGALGKMFYFIIKRLEFLPRYMNLMFKEMVEENVQHVDLRLRLGSVYEVINGKQQRVSLEKECELYLNQLEFFRNNGKTFAIIACFSKSAPPHRVNNYFKEIESLLSSNSRYGKLIRGYDLVGDEEKGHQLIEYNDIITSKTMPFFFHAGETQNCVENIRYSVQNGGNRIGHGIHCLKDKALTTEIIAKKIALEVCPISNFDLNAVKDFSLYKRLLDQGLMVTLSPDDPNKLDDKNMTDNIVFVLRNCNFTLRDVYNCCLRSIDYALIESDARRVEMEICFQSQFREWAISYQQDVSPKIEQPHDFYTFQRVFTNIDVNAFQWHVNRFNPSEWKRVANQLTPDWLAQIANRLQGFISQQTKYGSFLSISRPNSAIVMQGSSRQFPQIFQHSNLVVGIAFNDDLNIKLIPRARNNADCAYAPVVTKVAGYGIYVVSSDCLKYFDLKTTTRHLVLGF